ncbi:Carbohydrate/starch-binding module (family 21) [Fontibacillus panacisegetis]|uniref:Carbohydrate/starch-binding module (Family 21) n=1 Tax=Fontibacillus panacisegetis TaxID=670482 RepID=A0A1G7EHP6_9BACL|nr:carbohydrate-binding protein [Fontibacillus panacisegetis]SDE63173.1 Carbohydrate/starch-binding module (family 21) [Fontibacillus panacisegetis]
MIKMRRILTLFMLSAIISIVSFIGSASASGNEVKLIDSQIVRDRFSFYSFTGNIEVANLGYAKSVTVHYTTDDVTWYDIDAQYVAPTSSTHEKWNFSIYTSSLTTNHPELKNLNFVKFAIKYTVNGNTYWDNNNSLNYYNEPNTVFPNSAILGNVDVIKAYDFLYTDTFSGAVYVKNINPTKTVKIVYTTDNWATTHEGYATYVNSSNNFNTVELWTYSFNVPGATEVKYAIAYSSAGSTYWDNNYGSNYTVH